MNKNETPKRNVYKLTTMALAGALAFVIASPGGGVAEANAEAQPRMRAALYTLKRAEGQLSKASHDKAGHRVRALVATRAAIKEVERGIRYDNKN